MKKYRQFILLFIFISLTISNGKLFSETDSIPKLKTVTIFHTNDMHGSINNMGKVFAIVEKERIENSNTFLVSAGDNFSGNPVVDQYDPKGEPMLILMNRLKYSVEELGNHDFDYGQKILKRFISKAHFPLLCANVNILEGNSFPKPYPYYLIKKKDGTEIVFLGIVQIEKNTGIPSTLPEKVNGFKFSNGIETVKKFLYLKRDTNIFIVVSHLGIEGDIRLAEQTRGIDLIVGGHSHTVIENPKEINGTLIVQAGSYLKYLGRVDITIKNNKILSKKGKLINLSKVHLSDKKTDLLVKHFNNNPVLNKIIAKLAHPISGRRKLGLLVTDALRKRLNLDIVFYNKGGIRKNRLSDNVTIKDIYSMHPFGNYIIKILMDSAEIKDLIKNDFIAHKGIDIISSGISYRVVRDLKNRVIAVELFGPDGKEIDNNRKFNVGLNNYIVTSYKFSHKDPGVSLNMKTVDIMLDYFKNLKESPDYNNIVRARDLVIFRGKLEKIGRTEADIYTNDDKYNKNSTSGNLVCDAIRNYSEADISIYPTRLLRKGVKIESGKAVFSEAISGMFDHLQDNRVITVKISGKTLHDFLLLNFRRNNNIAFHFSGLTCKLLQGPGHNLKEIELILPDKMLFQRNKYYKVAFIDYEFNKFYKFKGDVLSKTVLPYSIFKILKDYIQMISVIPSKIEKERVFFVK